MHGFRVTGTPEQLQRFLDRVYLACDVAGIAELPDGGGMEIWLQAPSAPLPVDPAVAVHRCATPDALASAWQRDDAVVQVHPGLIVRPPWVAPPPGFSGVDLVVPRGMAFGSGEHESTQLALRLMHTTCAVGGSLSDVGTGSGVLARYAQALGCAPVRACDVDADAVAAARALLPGATVVHGGAAALRVHGRTDHVVANMTTEELIASLPELVALWNRLGTLLLSGVRSQDVERVVGLMPHAPTYVLDGDRFTALGWSASAPGPRR